MVNISDNKPNTTDVGSLPDTHHKGKVLCMPPQGQGQLIMSLGLTLLKMSVSRYATDNLLKVKIYINDSPQQQIVR